MGSPTTSATETKWAIQQRRLPNQCELYKPCDIGYQSSVGTQGVCAIHAVLVNEEGRLSKSAVIGTEGVWAIHAVLVIQGHGLSKKNWLTANMDHPSSISTEGLCRLPRECVGYPRRVRWLPKECVEYPRSVDYVSRVGHPGSALATQGVRWLPKE